MCNSAKNITSSWPKWEETDPEEEWLIVQFEVIENNVIVKDAVKEKTSLIYVYNRW